MTKYIIYIIRNTSFLTCQINVYIKTDFTPKNMNYQFLIKTIKHFFKLSLFLQKNLIFNFKII